MSNNLKDLEAMHVVVKEFRTITKANRDVLLKMLTQEHEQIGDVVDDPFYSVKKWYIEGGRRDKIPAIKQVRDIAGKDPTTGYSLYGLKEAKDLVESW